MSSNPFDRVEPGDVITSELINYVLDKLREHDERIADFETNPTGNRVTISQIVPADQQAVARDLELRGSNFLHPPDRNIVTIGGVRVTSFLASTTTILRFNIPPLSGALPRNVELSVENANGRVARSYRVTPEVPAVGPPPSISSVLTAAGSGTLRVGQPIVITGANFAAQPSNNIIRIRSLVLGHETESYDVTNINASTSTQTQINATLPGNIVVHDAENGDQMHLTLTVGAHNPIERFVTVRPSNA